jgi:hypothetical protein
MDGNGNGAEHTPEAPPDKWYVSIEFADDHTISGAKITIRNVTPEQLVVAAHYLTRVANQIEDARELQGAAMQSQTAAIMRELQGGTHGR